MLSYKEIQENEINNFVSYCKEKLNINQDVNVVIKKFKKTNYLFGYVDMLKCFEGINEIAINENNNVSLNTLLTYIAHEITHIKQIINKELSLSENKKDLLWLNNKCMSVNVYNNYVKKHGVEKYMQIPFEFQAYHNEKKLIRDYKPLFTIENLLNI
jgi:hypothetical protein